MEMDFKDFAQKIKSSNQNVNSKIYSYDEFIEVMRLDLKNHRKEEYDKKLDMDIDESSRDKVVIKNKKYLEDKKRIRGAEIREILFKKGYKVRGYEKDTNLLVKKLVDEYVGYSALTNAFEDPEVSDIFCLKYDLIFVEKAGQNELYPYKFKSEKHYNDFLERLIKESGKELNKGDSKILDFELFEDRYCAIDDLVSPNGKSVTIRKHSSNHITLEQIIKWGCMSQEVADFLGMLIAGESNLIYAGLTGSGKTTSIRALLDFYVAKLNKRMLVCEDTRELFPSNEHTLELVTVKNEDKDIAVDLRQLIMTALRLKPKYICVGEVRGVEAESAVEAMATGHSTIFTMHAGKPMDAIDRLVDKFLMAIPNISSEVAERKVANSVDYVAIQDDIYGIGRKVTSITEVSYDFDSKRVVLKPIMKYNFITNDFDFVNKISEAKAETMMRRGVKIEQLYKYTEWESDMYKNHKVS